MRVKTGDGMSSLRNLDVVGNLIFIPSMVSLLFGLVTGGIQYPWSSWRIILSLALGAAGWVCFHVQQHVLSSNPLVPTRFFSDRTAATGFALCFLASTAMQTAGYFLPVYFQAVLTASAFDSGIYFLPMAIGTLFFAVIGGILLSKWRAYRPIHAATFGFAVIGFGLLTLLGPGSPKVAWAFFQLIIASLGVTFSVTLPSVLASLPESHVAAASAAFAFIKTFGFVWGVTIPSIIFNAMFNANLSLISNLTLQSQVMNGGAYSFASQGHRVAETVGANAWGEVVQVYVISLKAILWFGLGVSALSLCIVPA